MRIGLVHPGEMGSALGAALVGAGHEVRWASAGRSADSASRAEGDGLADAGTVSALAAWSELIISVCPPHAALDVAGTFAGYTGVYLDANAISPETARHVGRAILAGGGRFVDGGIVGPPPRQRGTTRLFLSGPDATETSEAFATPLLETQVVSEWPGAASALKLSYSAWTKGMAALLLVVRAAAAKEGVDAWLLDEWRTSQPELAERSAAAARSAVTKGWRWEGEMAEIAGMLAADGLPSGFHTAAAEVYGRIPRDPHPEGTNALESVIAALLEGPPAAAAAD